MILNKDRRPIIYQRKVERDKVVTEHGYFHGFHHRLYHCSDKRNPSVMNVTAIVEDLKGKTHYVNPANIIFQDQRRWYKHVTEHDHKRYDDDSCMECITDYGDELPKEVKLK